jgi:hypothetical protein
MTMTTAQLATRVLQRLERIDETETPTIQQLNLVREFYAGTWEELRALGRAWWERDAIPDEAFQALADFLAGRIAPDFGLARPDLEQSGDARLKALNSAGAADLPVTGTFF